MVAQYETTVVIGSKDHPRFVPKSFYDIMMEKTALYQLDHILHADTIKYYIPAHQVVERKATFREECQYSISVTDTDKKPKCHRSKLLHREIYQMLPRKAHKYLLDVSFREVCRQYFLLVPNAGYFNTEIYKNWDEKFVLYDDRIWTINFRHVYVDPYDSSECVWFAGTPKYQVYICCQENLLDSKEYLQQAILALLPRSHLWE